MCTVIELLDCAETNLDNGEIGLHLAKLQIKQYKALKNAGISDEEDVDNALLKHPECSFDNLLYKLD